MQSNYVLISVFPQTYIPISMINKYLSSIFQTYVLLDIIIQEHMFVNMHIDPIYINLYLSKFLEKPINSVFSILGGSFSIGFITSIINEIVSAIGIIEKLLFLGLGLTALNMGTIAIPAVDNLVNKCFE